MRFGKIDQKKVYLKLDKDGLDVADRSESDSSGLDTDLEEDKTLSSECEGPLDNYN